MTWGLDSNGTADPAAVQTYNRFDSLGRATRQETRIPSLGHARAVRYTYDPDHRSRTILYPDSDPQVTWRFGADGNVKEIREFASPLLRQWHQGTGRLIEQERRILVNVGAPVTRQIDLRLREGTRYDPLGQPVRRTLRITDQFSRPTAPGDYSNLMPLDPTHQRFVWGADGMIENMIFATHETRSRYDGAGRLIWTLEEQGRRARLVEYERDGANLLHEIVTTESDGGTPQTTTTRSVTYRPNVRTRTDVIDNRSIVWSFNREGTLRRSSEFFSTLFGLGTTSGATRTFEHDAADRLTGVRVRNPTGFGAFAADVAYLYDVFGRRVARIEGNAGDDLADRPRETFLFDEQLCIEEYDREGRKQRTYVHDDTGQVVAYRFRDDSGRLVDTLPITLIDGSPLLVVQRRIALAQLPPPPAANAALPLRQAYIRDQIPLILERHVWRPFETPAVTRFDYSSGTAAASSGMPSLLPTVGDRRLHTPEGLLYNLHRFYDPDLQGFTDADWNGAWADATAMGNATVFGGNNAVMLADDGNVAWFVPVLLYLGYTLLTATVETVVERGIHEALGEGDFNWGTTFARNYGVGLLTNWIPFSSVGRVGGRIAASTAIKAGARLGGARLAYTIGRYGARTALSTGIEFGYEVGRGSDASLGGILVGNLLGDGVGSAFEKTLGRRIRRVITRARLARDLRRARQWLRKTDAQRGDQVFINGRHSAQLLRSAMRADAEVEFGVIKLLGRGGRRNRAPIVLRRGDKESVPMKMIGELQLGHIHPPGGPWLRHRLPAPRDISMPAHHAPYVLSRRYGSAGGEILSTTWHHRLRGADQLRITPDMIDDFFAFENLMKAEKLGRREGNSWIFGRIQDYQFLFLAYERLFGQVL
jgi:hypothetical protein